MPSVKSRPEIMSPSKLNGKTATLKLTGIGGMSGNDEMIGTVAIVKEDSGWKIDSENWSNKQP